MSYYKDRTEKMRLLKHFTEKYPYDEEFMKDVLMQCGWSKSQTIKTLQELMEKESTEPPAQHKDNATGQKTDSLSPAQKSVPPTQIQSEPPPVKLLDAKSYRQLVERSGVFRMTFYLGDVQFSSELLRNFAPRVFFEYSHLKYLSERLNWWSRHGNYTPLAPLKTRGDGNCLLHAVSRALIGVEDDELVLRERLYQFLTDRLAIRSLKNRWKQQQAFLNGRAGFEFDASEWESEWQTVLSLASPDLSLSAPPSSERVDTPPSLPYKSLEEIHVFALAHVIRRPIIVIADSFLQDVEGTDMSPVYFGGVYLPLDRDPKDCYQIPVVLTYCCSHFAPLIPCYNDLLTPGASTEGYKEVVVPLVDHGGQLLSIQFQYDHERPLEAPFLSYSKQRLSLLREYLYVEDVPVRGNKVLLVAKIFPNTHEFYSDIVNSLVRLTEVKLLEYTAKRNKELREKEVKALPSNPLNTSPLHGYYTRSYHTASSILPVPLHKDILSSKPDPINSARPYSSYHKPDPPSTTRIDPISRPAQSYRTLPFSSRSDSSYYKTESTKSDPLYSYKTDSLGFKTDPLSALIDPLSPRPDLHASTKSDSLSNPTLGLSNLGITPSSTLPTTSIVTNKSNHSRSLAPSHTQTIEYPPSSRSPEYTDQIITRSVGINTDLSSQYTSKLSYNSRYPSSSKSHTSLTGPDGRHKDTITSINEPFPTHLTNAITPEYLARRRKERQQKSPVNTGEILDLYRYLRADK